MSKNNYTWVGGENYDLPNECVGDNLVKILFIVFGRIIDSLVNTLAKSLLEFWVRAGIFPSLPPSLSLSPFLLTLLTFPLLAVCCALSNANITFFGRRDKKRAYAHAHRPTRLSHSHTHSRHSHTALAFAQESAPHTHTLRQAGRQTQRLRWLRQRRSRSSQQQQQRPLRRFWLVDDVGNRKSELSARSAAETHTARNEWVAKVLRVQCVRQIVKGKWIWKIIWMILIDYKYIQY